LFSFLRMLLWDSSPQTATIVTVAMQKSYPLVNQPAQLVTFVSAAHLELMTSLRPRRQWKEHLLIWGGGPIARLKPTQASGTLFSVGIGSSGSKQKMYKERGWATPVGLASGANHSAFWTNEGEVWTVGSNACGACQLIWPYSFIVRFFWVLLLTFEPNIGFSFFPF
jgi:hypothetical protein